MLEGKITYQGKEYDVSGPVRWVSNTSFCVDMEESILYEHLKNKE